MGAKTQSLAHTRWLCKYHIVFTPKYRRKIIFAQLRESIRAILKICANTKGWKFWKGISCPIMFICLSVSHQKSVYQVLWDIWKEKVRWWSSINMQLWSISSATASFGPKDITSAQWDWTKQPSVNIFNNRSNTISCKTNWRQGNIKTPSRGRPKRQRHWAWTKWKPAPLDAGR